jgi:DNA polymerase-1
MFIGDMPSELDQMRNRNFIGDAGKIFDYSLKYSGINRSQVYLTNIVKNCLESPSSGKKKKKRQIKIKEVKEYLPILIKEIEIVNPELIILLGGNATLPFFKHKSIQDKRGFIHNHSSKMFGDRKIIVTYHPSAFLSANPLWEVMVADLRRVERVITGTYDPSVTQIQVLDTFSEVVDFLQKTDQSKELVSWDVETDGLNFWDTRGIACYSFTRKPGEATVIPLYDGGKPIYSEKVRPSVEKTVFDFLTQGQNLLLTQNGQFDWNFVFGTMGVEDPRPLYYKWAVDTYLMHCLLEEDRPHDLEYQASLHTDMAPWDRLVKKYRAKHRGVSYMDIPGKILWPYAGGDTDAVYRLFEGYYPRLIEEDLEEFYFEQQQKIARVIAEIAYRGIPVNLSMMDALIAKYELQREDLSKEIYKLAGEEFNIRSYMQKGRILYEKLGLSEVSPRTEAGYYATDKTTLEILAKKNEHPICKPLHEYSTINKYLTGYLGDKSNSIRSNTGPDGRCRASWTAQETGRYGASSPSLTNIPRKGGFREIFEALEGWAIIDADYSQAELRYFAYDAGEQSVIDAFNAGYDGHTATAASIYNVPLDEVTPEMRAVGKTVNFLMQYGGGPKKLADEAGVSVRKAKAILKKFFDNNPALAARIAEINEQAFDPDIRMVRNAYGRVRHAPIAFTKAAREAFGRELVNSISQGGVADTVWRAMIKLNKWFMDNGLLAHFVLVLHDGVYVMCPMEEVDLVMAKMKEIMTEPIPQIGAVLPVDISVGERWQGK